MGLLVQQKEIIIEQWKQISNTNYEISTIGQVRNLLTGQLLKQKIDKYGYPCIGLITLDKQKIYKTTHRLVAEAWIPNLYDLPQINHIDGNKLNNHISNLEWISAKDNINHSYKHLLNPNTNHCTLYDALVNKTVKFQSVKSAAKYLNIRSNVLHALIRYSNMNPILNRYIIKLENENNFRNLPNSINFGDPIWVFDLIKVRFTQYPSINMAAYFTGIRSLSSLRFKEYLVIAGYIVSKNKELIKSIIPKVDLMNLEEKRTTYILAPYRPVPNSYILYNYYTKEEFSFNDTESIALFLNKLSPDRIITKAQISCRISDAAGTNRTGLIKGFGIKSESSDFAWYQYTEEVILSSKFGFKAPMRIYKVIFNGVEELIIGTEELVKKFNYPIGNKSLYAITQHNVLKFVNIPNLRIDRLNKPICN